MEIYNYKGAYLQRAKDVKVLLKQKRFVLAMHLGGIVIECIFGSIIAVYFGVIESTTNPQKWLITKNLHLNVVEGDKKRYILVPKAHNLNEWIYLTRELIVLPKDIVQSIKRLQKPLNNMNYINLRYYHSNTVDTQY